MNKQPSPIHVYLDRLGVRDRSMTRTVRIDSPELFKMYNLGGDIYKNSFWDVDDSDWGDSGKQFELGN